MTKTEKHISDISSEIARVESQIVEFRKMEIGTDELRAELLSLIENATLEAIDEIMFG